MALGGCSHSYNLVPWQAPVMLGKLLAAAVFSSLETASVGNGTKQATFD